MSPAYVLEGPFSRSVREALESVVAPAVAQDVISAALAIAGRATVPEDAPPFAAFYEGPLRSAVITMLAPGALEIVDERLSHVLRMARSEVRPCDTLLPGPRGEDEQLWEEDSAVRPTPRGLETPLPPGTALPVILALTLDPLLVADVQSRLPGSRVLSIPSMDALLAQLSSAHPRITIVIDTALPSVDVPTVASLASAIPESAIVVLWGLSERQKERLVTLFPVARTWIATSAIGAIVDRIR